MSFKSTLHEFKEFAMKGNVVDMAIGVIIGGAFGTIINSLVGDVFMPLIGKITGGTDFTQLFLPLDGNSYPTLEAAQAATATLAYGSFLTQILNFLIIAFVLFMVMKIILKVEHIAIHEEAPAPTTKTCPFCKTDISIEASRCPNCTSHLEEI